MPAFTIGQRSVGDAHPVYFIADIAANHDGDLERAKRLIELAKDAGAGAAKYRNYRAPEIASRRGFERLGAQQAHQAAWKKTVFQVYSEATIPWEWTPALEQYCRAVGIDYFSAPYDFGAVDMLEPYVPAYKIGSGDITWLEMLRKIAGKRKPVLLACGAADLADVQRAVDLVRGINPQLGLMQCNTNYTGRRENFRYVNLNVLRAFQTMFPDVVLGLSDHTPGHAAVLGAVALGARMIEKHFTDDPSREGPDHGFSMSPTAWREMVERTRELEQALGTAVKRVEDNEQETVVVQRRCLRAAADLPAGSILTRDLLTVLRPAPREAIGPHEVERVLGKRLAVAVAREEHLTWTMLRDP